VFKDSEKIEMTPIRKLIKDLDSLPYSGHLPESLYVANQGRSEPIRKSGIYKKYARYQGSFLSAVSSRGCPFSCNYCCNSVYRALYGADILRNRSPEKVVDEIFKEVQYFKNILYVNFQDDCFMMHTKEWISTFCNLYSQKVKIPFIVRTTPRHIIKEKLVLLKEAALRWVFMGVQTGSDRINKEIYGRNVTSKEYLEKAGWVSELGLCPWYDVILDNPYETEEDHLETIDVLLKTSKPFQLDIFLLDFFLETRLRQKALDDKIPLPEVGSKSYTEPEPTMINRYLRMSTTLPRRIIRFLVKHRNSAFAKLIRLLLFPISIFLELFIYIWLIYKSNDFKLYRSLKVVDAFYLTAFKKLILRYQG
jgi:anaerobic magnesium-protoporphyrin IX monomethyl ester cyclase